MKSIRMRWLNFKMTRYYKRCKAYLIKAGKHLDKGHKKKFDRLMKKAWLTLEKEKKIFRECQQERSKLAK